MLPSNMSTISYLEIVNTVSKISINAMWSVSEIKKLYQNKWHKIKSYLSLAIHPYVHLREGFVELDKLAVELVDVGQSLVDLLQHRQSLPTTTMGQSSRS